MTVTLQDQQQIIQLIRTNAVVCFRGTSSPPDIDPTKAGDLYEDTTSGDTFLCVEVSGVLNWVQIL